VQALLQQAFVKVDQQPQSAAAPFQVGQQLSTVIGLDSLNRLDFHDYAISDQEIGTKGLLNNISLSH